MMKKLLSTSLIFLALQGCATMDTPTSNWQPATLLNSHEQIIHSAWTNKDYLVQVATIGKKPKNGYPVVYVLDGNAFFAPSSSIAQMLHGRPNQAHPKSFLVVGIGYTTKRQFDIPNRTHDYTPPSHTYPTPKGEQTMFGGAEHFYQFITHELTPRLDKDFGINAHHRTLWGHSYGGLFGLYALFNHPKSFDNYVIASPSIWWNHKSIHQHQDNFSPTPNINRILITLGEQELTARHRNPDAPTSTLTDADAYVLHQFLHNKLPNAHVSFALNQAHSHGLNAYPSLIQGLTLAYTICQADRLC